MINVTIITKQGCCAFLAAYSLTLVTSLKHGTNIHIDSPAEIAVDLHTSAANVVL